MLGFILRGRVDEDWNWRVASIQVQLYHYDFYIHHLNNGRTGDNDTDQSSNTDGSEEFSKIQNIYLIYAASLFMYHINKELTCNVSQSWYLQ
jgi:hypothetical protein